VGEGGVADVQRRGRGGAEALTVTRLPRVFWWLWAGMLVNSIGAFTLPFLAYFLARDLHLRPAAIGGLLAGFGAGSLSAALNAGWISDRFGRRHVLLAAQLSTAAATAAFAFVRDVPAFAVLVFVFGVAINVPNPVLRALVADVVSARQRARAYATTGWATALGAAAAPLLGGLIASRSGFTVLFLVDAATTLVYAVITYARVAETRAAAVERAARTPVLLADRALLWVVLLNACFAIVYFQGQATLPIVLARHGVKSSAYGAVLAAGTIVTLALQIPTATVLQRLPRRAAIAAGCVTTGIGFGLTAFASSPAAYAVTVAIWSVGALAVTPFTAALVSELAPAAAQGRYQSAYQLSWSGSRLVAPPLGTLTLQHAGQDALWGGCAALGLVAAVGHLLRR
jgi:MFS family permease